MGARNAALIAVPELACMFSLAVVCDHGARCATQWCIGKLFQSYEPHFRNGRGPCGGGLAGRDRQGKQPTQPQPSSSVADGFIYTTCIPCTRHGACLTQPHCAAGLPWHSMAAAVVLSAHACCSVAAASAPRARNHTCSSITLSCCTECLLLSMGPAQCPTHRLPT
jgi:hypothetical protein